MRRPPLPFALMSENEAGSPDDPLSDRWSRGANEREPSRGSAALPLSNEDAALLAKRAERAARVSPTERVSVRRTNSWDPETVVDLSEPDEVIELDAPLDLRASSTPDPIGADVGADAEATLGKPGWSPGPPSSVAPKSGGPSSLGSSGSGVPKARTPPNGGLGLQPVSPREDEPDVAPATRELTPLQHAVLPALVEHEPTRNSTSSVLLVIAGVLALLSGVLGLMWILERSTADDLRIELAQAQAGDDVADQGLDELNDEVRTLRLQNAQLEQQRNELSALVLELPEGRITEISVPFIPTFADEAENGRLIAVSNEGEYIIWGEGAEGPITDSGNVSGSPTGLFAATGKAWISTDAGQIDAVSLVGGEGLPSAEVGPTSFLVPEDRGYWTFNSETGEVVRRKKSDSSVTAAVAVPVDVVDLTIGAGSVWALGADGRVYRINTADLTVTPLDAGADLIGVTAGPDALWTLSAADGSLRRVDPVTGEVLVTVPVGRDPIDATFAGSSVWVALRSGSSLIEVDTRTAAVVSRTPLSGEPTALHQGESGVFVTTTGEMPLIRVSSLTTPEVGPFDESEDPGESTDDS
jgi:hypothetical protein